MTSAHGGREDAARFDSLIERSSLGTLGARRLRERIPHAEARYIRQLADLLEATREAGVDEAAAARANRAAGHESAKTRERLHQAAGPVGVIENELAAIREDPQIKRLALRYSGSPDLAEDALQSTYCAVAQVKHLERIENLRAYFCKMLIHEVHRERVELGAALVEDFARVAEAHQDARGCDAGWSPAPIDDAVCTSLQAQAWLERFAAEGDHLRAAVPARSDDPGRYQAVIYDVAGQVLRDAINGESSKADSNPAFRAAYPEYFDQPDIPHQRFSRARSDLRALLQGVVRHDELT